MSCLFHVSKEKRSKLDASGKKGMFVGYNETLKAYRVYVPGQMEVEICHDVTFDEDASLRKVVNLLRSEEYHEARPGNQEGQKDETMLDVEGPVGVAVFWPDWKDQKMRQHHNHFGALGSSPPGPGEGSLQITKNGIYL